MSGYKNDNVKLGNRYQMIMEGTNTVLEEGIKDIVLSGLLGLMAMSSVQGKDITKDTGRHENKTQIQQMIKSVSSSDQLKKVILQVVGEELQESQEHIKYLQQTHGQVRSGFEKAPERIKANNMYDNIDRIESTKEHIKELQQLQQEIQDTTDAGQIANLVHNAQISAGKLKHQQTMNNIEGRVGSIQSSAEGLR
jgi:hypothetical protein